MGGPDLRFFCKTKVLGAVERKVEEEKKGGGGKTKGWTYEVKKEDGEEGDELDKYSEVRGTRTHYRTWWRGAGTLQVEEKGLGDARTNPNLPGH